MWIFCCLKSDWLPHCLTFWYTWNSGGIYFVHSECFSITLPFTQITRVHRIKSIVRIKTSLCLTLSVGKLSIENLKWVWRKVQLSEIINALNCLKMRFCGKTYLKKLYTEHKFPLCCFLYEVLSLMPTYRNKAWEKTIKDTRNVAKILMEVRNWVKCKTNIFSYAASKLYTWFRKFRVGISYFRNFYRWSEAPEA